MGGRDWRLFINGGLASIVAEFGTFPIDTTKTRLQIQGQKLECKNAELKYRGMFHALLHISKEEGLRALYAGMAPAILRQASYGTIKFGTYYWLQGMLQKEGEQATTPGLARNVGCAVTAGVLASSIANPTDVLKVRMQADRSKTIRGGLIHCFMDIYHLEGVRGLWRGVGPTAQRAAIIAAVELPVYDMCKQRFMVRLGDGVANHFSASLIASLGSAIASTPIDVIRTRLMNQRRLKTHTGPGLSPQIEARIYKGSIDCLVQTVKNEGVMALYKGFIPTFVRMGPWNIIFFITFERLKKLY